MNGAGVSNWLIYIASKARSPSGKAKVCKTFIGGSIPPRASNITISSCSFSDVSLASNLPFSHDLKIRGNSKTDMASLCLTFDFIRDANLNRERAKRTGRKSCREK
jgi:hypothetical protein